MKTRAPKVKAASKKILPRKATAKQSRSLPARFTRKLHMSFGWVEIEATREDILNEAERRLTAHDRIISSLKYANEELVSVADAASPSVDSWPCVDATHRTGIHAAYVHIQNAIKGNR